MGWGGGWNFGGRQDGAPCLSVNEHVKSLQVGQGSGTGCTVFWLAVGTCHSMTSRYFYFLALSMCVLFWFVVANTVPLLDLLAFINYLLVNLFKPVWSFDQLWKLILVNTEPFFFFVWFFITWSLTVCVFKDYAFSCSDLVCLWFKCSLTNMLISRYCILRENSLLI